MVFVGHYGPMLLGPRPARDRAEPAPLASRAAVRLEVGERSSISSSFFSPANAILLPGMNSLGLATYSAIVAASQVTPEFFIASEYLKPSTVPALRPITPCKVGPTLFLAVAISWQVLHLAKTFSPLAASPSACAGPPSKQASAA